MQLCEIVLSPLITDSGRHTYPDRQTHASSSHSPCVRAAGKHLCDVVSSPFQFSRTFLFVLRFSSCQTADLGDRREEERRNRPLDKNISYPSPSPRLHTRSSWRVFLRVRRCRRRRLSRGGGGGHRVGPRRTGGGRDKERERYILPA